MRIVIIGSIRTIFNGQEALSACKYVAKAIEINIKRLEHYFDCYDEELVDILISMQNSNLVETINTAIDNNTFETMMRTRLIECIEFYNLLNDLIKYTTRNGYPTTPVEYINFSQKSN